MPLLLASAALADCVILLHGLARGPDSLGRIERALRDDGHLVINEKYASTDLTVEALAASAIPAALARCAPADPVHFVTHSMGGILLRQYLSTNVVPNLGRSVMIAPPNRGSEIVDFFDDLSAFEWINGPAGLQLGTSEAALPRQLGPANFELGIIAGTKSVSPVFSQIIAGRDDGKVSVASTKLDGMDDHIEISGTHTFISMRSDTLLQVRAFLKTGSFDHSQ